MTSAQFDSEKVRVIRELIAEAEVETPHTTEEAKARPAVVSFLREKLDRAGRVRISGD